MIKINVSKHYLFVVGLLTFGYVYMSLTFSTAFWASTVFLIFLMMYLIHEPIHVLIAIISGVDVLEVNLGNHSHTLFTAVDDDNPNAEKIEAMIYGGGFAVDFAGFLYVSATCLLWGMAHNDFIPIVYGAVIAIVFLIGLTIPGSDWQEASKRINNLKKAGA